MVKNNYKNYQGIINDKDYLDCYCEIVKIENTHTQNVKWVIVPVYEFAHADVCDVDIIAANCPWDMYLTNASITYRRHLDEIITTTMLDAVDDMLDINTALKEWRKRYLGEEYFNCY